MEKEPQKVNQDYHSKVDGFILEPRKDMDPSAERITITGSFSFVDNTSLLSFKIELCRLLRAFDLFTESGNVYTIKEYREHLKENYYNF